VPESCAIGRLTRNGVLIGYVAIDEQRLSLSQRQGFRRKRWSETRRRCRLDLLGDWDEGFMDPDDDADIDAGRFRYKGEVLAYEELVGDEAQTVFAERFAEWA
jgi:hypothetical protein